jgi:hypothetical protein
MPYPTLPIVQDDSDAARLSGIEPTRATNGLLKVRRLFSADKTDFTVVHLLGRADRDTLMAFYAANVTTEFTFYWPGDGATYTVRFAAAPQSSRRSNHYRVTVRLSEV